MIAQSASDGLGAGAVFLWVVIAWIISGLAFYGVFTKAGKPGWAGFVPIYNWIVLLEVSGRPAWWIILFLIPFLNVVIWIIVMLDLAKSFGKGAGFAIGLILFSWLFMMILGFGSASYLGPAAGVTQGGGTVPPPPPGTS